MNAHEKTFGSPSGEPSTTRPYASIECAKKSGHYPLFFMDGSSLFVITTVGVSPRHMARPVGAHAGTNTKRKTGQ